LVKNRVSIKQDYELEISIAW